MIFISVKFHLKTALFSFFCIGYLLINTPKSPAIEQLRIETLGRIFNKVESQQLRLIHFSETEIVESDLGKLENFPSLSEIAFHKTTLPETTFDHLQELKHLQILKLENVLVSTKTLLKISNLTQIKTLRISTVKITPEVLVEIGKIKNLTTLEISQYPINHRMVQALNGLNRLKVLILKDAHLDDNTFSVINLPNLKQLDVSKSTLTGNGFKDGSRFLSLSHLNVSFTMISDESFVHLKQLKALKYLDLSNTLLSDKSIKELATFQDLDFLLLDNLPLTTKVLPLLVNLNKLSKLSISGINIEYEDLKSFEEKTDHLKVIAHYLITAPQGRIKSELSGVSPVDRKAKFVLKEPVLMGMIVPFEIMFLKKNQEPDRDFQITDNIILSVRNTEFNVFLGNNHYIANQTLEIPADQISLTNGIITGEITFKRITTGSTLEIYSKSSFGHPELLSKNRIDLFFNQVAGILFHPLSDKIIAGEAFTIEAQLFDYLGDPLIGKLKHRPVLKITSQYPLEINQQKVSKWYKIDTPDDDRPINLTIICKKAGSYTIHFENTYYYGIKQIGHFWNTFTFKVGPNQPIKSIFEVSEKVLANQTFAVHRFDLDQYNNRVISQLQTELVFTEATNTNILINGKPLKSKSTFINTSTDLIAFQHPGLYELKLKGLARINTKKIVVQ
jgi:hypothetical protein